MKFLLTGFLAMTCAIIVGQSSFCSMDTISPQTYQAMNQQYQAIIGGDMQGAIGQEFDIPVHIYILQESGTGRLPFGKTRDQIEAMFLASLDYTNNQLRTYMQFYVSESTIVPNAPGFVFFGSTNLRAMSNFVDANITGGVDDNAINVFLIESVAGRARFPYGIYIGGAMTSGRLLTHEFGHLFGLLHTHHLAYPPAQSDVLYLTSSGDPTVDYPTNDLIHNGFSNDYCQQNSSGLCYGDFIASTPVDLLERLSMLDRFQFNAQQSVQITYTTSTGQTNTETYEYDFFNSMSLWGYSATELNVEQKDRMYQVLTVPDLGYPPFGGDMSYLIDGNTPLVTFVPPTYKTLKQYSNASIYRYDVANGDTFFPFYQGKISVHSSDNDIYDIIDDINAPYAGRGIIKNNRYIRVDNTAGTLHWDFSELSEGCEDLDFYDFNQHIRMSDVVAIVNHILSGNQNFISPYRRIAADADGSGSINVLDAVALQKRILGLDSRYDNLPDIQFLPGYPLVTDPAFANAFVTNPFTATWQYNGSTYGYLETGNQLSYLGQDVVGVTQTRNTVSFDMKLSDAATASDDELAFTAIRTGDVIDDGVVYNFCDDDINEGAVPATVLRKQTANAVDISITAAEDVDAIEFFFALNPDKAGAISSVNGQNITATRSYVGLTDANSFFHGGVAADTRTCQIASLVPKNTGDVYTVSLIIEGLTEDVPLDEFLELDCTRSQVTTTPSYAKSIVANNTRKGAKSIFRVTSNEWNTSISSGAENSLSVYPNPITRSYFNIRYVSSRNTDQYLDHVQIISVDGKLVYDRQNLLLEQQQSTINVNSIPNGIYFLRCQIGDEVITQKIVIQK